jgi:RNA polymerase sigma-70 factor (ECF subfamily)
VLLGDRVETSTGVARITLGMDESLLVQLAREGREPAIEELFTQVWPLAWHWAYGVTADRTLAEHVAQDAIYRAFGSLERFDPTRPFRPWLKRITINLAIDELRRARREGSTDEASGTLASVDARDEDTPRSAVIEAVRALPPRQRLVIALHYWLDCPLDEIASILNIPVGTVASRMSRARAVLREQLEVHLER